MSAQSTYTRGTAEVRVVEYCWTTATNVARASSGSEEPGPVAPWEQQAQRGMGVGGGGGRGSIDTLSHFTVAAAEAAEARRLIVSGFWSDQTPFLPLRGIRSLMSFRGSDGPRTHRRSSPNNRSTSAGHILEF